MTRQITKNSNQKILNESDTNQMGKQKIEVLTATGKRKTAVAQIKLYPKGDNQILVNGKKLEEYFPYFFWQEIVKSPLNLVNLNNYRIIVKIGGGGTNAQAEAIRLGISRALVKLNSDYRSILKKAKFLTRDARIKERKKPGLKRARRAPQWQKR